MLSRFLLLTVCVLAPVLPACQSPSHTSVASGPGTNTLADTLIRVRTTCTSNTATDREVCTAATQQAAILWLAQSGGSRKPVTVQGSGQTIILSA